MSGRFNNGFESSEHFDEDRFNNNAALQSNGNFDKNFVPVGVHEIEDKPKKQNLTRKILTNTILHLIVGGYFAYVTYYYFTTRDSCVEDCALTLCSPYGWLLFCLGSTYLGFLHFKIIKPYFGKFLKEKFFYPLGRGVKSLFKTLISRIILIVVILLAFLAYIIFESRNEFSRLRAFAGIAIFIGIGYIISANRRKINWRPVICGAILQFAMGVLFIRLPAGRSIFECFGQKVTTFLNFGKEGGAFVYGDFLVYDEMIFAFAVLSIIYFFSLCVSVLYYLGAMQWVLFKLGWILQSILGTTVCESVNAAGNIFLGQTESPLVIRPYIKSLTHSEIHAVMTSGMATVSGSVLAAYISFGAQPEHLITASVMAAPASLFFSKLVYPETEQSNTSAGNIQLEKSDASSVLDAASNGASQAINLILNIIANLVSFVAVVAFANGVIEWITELAGFDDIGIEFLLGKIFMPVSWIIGIPWEYCDEIGNVIGTKTIINEFVAFQVLGRYEASGQISKRSAAIATFAICSFANPSSIGIMVGGLSALAPERRPSITKVVLRAFVSACFVTLITASIAGLLMPEDMY